MPFPVQPMLPLPSRPTRPTGSPELVRVLDGIRFALQERDDMAEFCWFAREYPRAYRHHFEHAEFRLQTIYSSFEQLHADYGRKVSDKAHGECFEMAVSNQGVKRVYWDFESYLAGISAALDVMARICGTAFLQDAPVSFRDFCKSAPDGALKNELQGAQRRWAQRMKDYRDCFIHYTPVDTLLTVAVVRCPNGWELRAKLPSNPKARDILRFRWARRTELLGYATKVWKKFMALDRAVARIISRAYREGRYPKRTSGLFRVGHAPAASGQPFSASS
jgi:hypothetical protein